jgi:hypothetical protein
LLRRIDENQSLVVGWRVFRLVSVRRARRTDNVQIHGSGGTATIPGFGTLTGYTATLGGAPIVTAADNDVITFTFTGDTSNVQTWVVDSSSGNVEAGGYLINVGTGSFSIVNNDTMESVASGTFLRSDNIFVSADNVNGGVGFGSNFTPMGGPKHFPGDAAYPIGVEFSRATTFTTLQDEIGIFGTGSVSCSGFPGGCGMPPALAVTDGDLVTDLVIGGPSGQSSPEGNFVAEFTTGGGGSPPPPAPVPEPSTWAMILLGFAGLGFAGRSSRQPRGA